MKKVCLLVLLLCSCCRLEAGELIPEVDFNLGTGIYSKYIWRGQNLVDNWVWQPTAGVSFKGLACSFWGNYDFDNSEWTERDLTLDYTTGLGFISSFVANTSLSIGYIYYTFPNVQHNLDEHDSSEIYLGIEFDILLAPSFTVYYDWDTGDGTYFEGGISHSVEIHSVTITLGVTVGYNNGQWGYEASFSNALFTIAAAVPVGQYLTAEVTIAESVALDSQYDSEFYGGINLSINF